MATKGTISYVDYSLETATTTINLADVNQANFDDVTTAFDAIKDAIDVLTLCTILDVTVSKSYPEVPTFPNNQNAQRERKWLVTLRDTTQFLDVAHTIANPGYLKLFNFEIPGADLSLLSGQRDSLDITAGAGQTFKNAIEANIRSPWNHSAAALTNPTVQMLSVVHVGRAT